MLDVKVPVLFSSVLRRSSIRDLHVGVFMDPEPDLKRIAEGCRGCEAASV
jgi:hypothetical protein